MGDREVRYFTCGEFKLVLDKVQECTDEIERLRQALTEIAVRGHIFTNGDCGVLRDHARVALGLEKLDE